MKCFGRQDSGSLFPQPARSRIAHASPSRNCLASDENSISLLSSFGGPPELLGAANGFRIDMVRKRVRKAVAALRSPEDGAGLLTGAPKVCTRHTSSTPALKASV